MKLVKISDIFDVKYGVNLALNQCEQQDGGIPFVSRTSENNGVSAYIKPLNIEPNHWWWIGSFHFLSIRTLL